MNACASCEAPCADYGCVMRKTGFGYGVAVSFGVAMTLCILPGCGGDMNSDNSAAASASPSSPGLPNNAPTVSMYPQGTLPTTATAPSSGRVSTVTQVPPIGYTADAARAAIAQQANPSNGNMAALQQMNAQGNTTNPAQ